MIKNTIIFIQRMNCSGCSKNVTKTLQALPGVEVTAIDLPTKLVHLSYDTEQTAMDTIKTLLAETKYPAIDHQLVVSQ